MALREEIIKITVDTKQGIVSINGVTTELKKAKAAFTEATAAISQNTAATSQNAAAQTANTAAQTQNSTARQVNYQNTTVSVDRLRRHIKFLENERATLSTNSKVYAEYSKQIANANQALFNMTQTGDQITRTNGAMASSAGLAGAATLELGRVFSDINYGIRGIANNVSQFATLFVSLSVSAGGAGKAFSEIVRQLRGPLGVLLAIQAGIALIEALDKKFGFFTKKVDESAKALEEFNKKLSGRLGAVELLKAFVTTLEDSTADIEDQEFALQQLKKAGFDPAIGSMEKFIEAQIKLATVTALSDQFKEEVSKIIEQKETLDKEVEDANTKVAELLKLKPGEIVETRVEFGAGPDRQGQLVEITREEALEEARRKVRDKSLNRERNYFNAIEELQKNFTSRVNELIDDNPFLDSLIGGKGDKQRKDVEAVGKDLIESRKNINKELLSVFVEGLEEQAQEGIQRELQELDIQFGIKKQKLEIEGATNEDLLILQEDYYKDRAEIIQKYNMETLQENAKAAAQTLIDDDKFRIKSTKRLNKYLNDQEKIRLKILKETTIKESDLDFDALMARLDSEQEAKIDALKETYRLRNLDLENNEQFQKDLLYIEEFYANKRAKARFDENKKQVDALKEVLGSMDSMLGSFAESRRAREEMELAIIESNTQKQLANEELTEGQRNEIRLNAEKQKEEIQKRSIVAEMKYQQTLFALKAAELAMDISMNIQKAKSDATSAQTSIVTSSAEAGVELSAGASKAAASAPPPFNIPSILLYAAQAAVIASGIIKAKREAKAALASIGQGGSLGPDPSPGSRAPQFNVVGASELSNLSETIATAEQANAPIRAYVVLDDLDEANNDKFTPQQEGAI